MYLWNGKSPRYLFTSSFCKQQNPLGERWVKPFSLSVPNSISFAPWSHFISCVESASSIPKASYYRQISVERSSCQPKLTLRILLKICNHITVHLSLDPLQYNANLLSRKQNTGREIDRNQNINPHTDKLYQIIGLICRFHNCCSVVELPILALMPCRQEKMALYMNV